MNRFRRYFVAGLSAAACMVATSNAITIDPGVPEGGYTGQTLTLPIKFTFMTSWDGIGWSEEQKNSARDGFAYLSSFFSSQPAFQEEAGPDDFTIRWAGEDLFKNWAEPYEDANGNGKYDEGEKYKDTNGNGKRDNFDKWNYSDALAFAVKPRPDNSTPWDQRTYPYNEVYFNTKYDWHYNPLTNPAEGDPDNDEDGEFDFWSVLLHETIHMMCVDGHAEHSDEVMYAYISDGQRKWELKESDKEMLRKAGYSIPDASTPTLLMTILSFSALAALRRRTSR